MLLGHSDSYKRDKVMQVTVAYNHFGEGLVQRMPSANPTINSEGNGYVAPSNPNAKEVFIYKPAIFSLISFTISNQSTVMRLVGDKEGVTTGKWKHWNWRSEGYLM
ncbi:putative pectate lyase [Helianthus anomalus]